MRRGSVVVLALVLATLATAGVFLYTRGVKQEAKTGGTLVPVVVSKVDIPANTDLSTLIGEKKFKTIDVPKDAVVEGAVTSIDQLQGQRNSVAILAGEQIPAARIQGQGTIPGGVLGIPQGYEAVTVNLEAPRAVAGALTGGDKVTIYATLNAPSGGTKTVVLMPAVQVLRVISPSSDTSGGQQAQASGSYSLTLAFTPLDAQRFVFASEQGSLYLGLLPPGAKGQPLKPIAIGQVVK